MPKKITDKSLLHAFFVNALQNDRSAPSPCPHFGACGGCMFADVPYAKQLEAKQGAAAFVARTVADRLPPGPAALLRASLQPLTDAGPLPIVPSPSPWAYRQRMDYVCAFGTAGLRRAGSHRRVEGLTQCPLLGARGFAAFARAFALASDCGWEPYDYIHHHGFLRYVVVRQTRDGQILVSLVTKTPDRADEARAILQQLHAEGYATSGWRLVAPGLGDTSFGEPDITVGAPWIVETLNNVRLRIGPNTFFQANPAVAERAYAALAAFCPSGGEVLDLYSGTGSIALSCAGHAGRVTAVENVPANVELARANLADCASSNVDLVLDDSAAYLARRAAAGNAPDLTVVNPPRPGVENGGMAALAALAPRRLAYLSCNPYTLFANLSEVLHLYTLRSLTLYDMFPQTKHFESLALLEKRS